MPIYKTLRRRSASRVGMLQHYYCAHSFPRVPMSLPAWWVCSQNVRHKRGGSRLDAGKGRARLGLALMRCTSQKSFVSLSIIPFSHIYISSRMSSPPSVIFVMDTLLLPLLRAIFPVPAEASMWPPRLTHLPSHCLAPGILLFHKWTFWAAATTVVIPAAVASLLLVPLLHLRPHCHDTAHAAPCSPKRKLSKCCCISWMVALSLLFLKRDLIFVEGLDAVSQAAHNSCHALLRRLIRIGFFQQKMGGTSPA